MSTITEHRKGEFNNDQTYRHRWVMPKPGWEACIHSWDDRKSGRLRAAACRPDGLQKGGPGSDHDDPVEVSYKIVEDALRQYFVIAEARELAFRCIKDCIVNAIPATNVDHWGRGQTAMVRIMVHHASIAITEEIEKYRWS